MNWTDSDTYSKITHGDFAFQVRSYYKELAPHGTLCRYSKKISWQFQIFIKTESGNMEIIKSAEDFKSRELAKKACEDAAYEIFTPILILLGAHFNELTPGFSFTWDASLKTRKVARW